MDPYREPAHAALRRARLAAMLAAIPTLAFDDAAADAYGAIVAHAGYSHCPPYVEDLRERKGPDADQPHRIAYEKLVRA